jgi:hypothetical protein
MGLFDGLSILFLPVALAAMLLLLVVLPVIIAGNYTIH